MTSEREHAEALLGHYRSLEAATEELAHELYNQLLSKVGWRDDINRTLRTAQELVRVEAEEGLRGQIDGGRGRRQSLHDDLRELVREMKA